MSKVKIYPLRDALAGRTSQCDKIILNRQMLESEEDFIATLLKDPKDKSRGYSFFTLDENLAKEFCTSENDIDKDKFTDIYTIKEEELENRVIGCNRYILPTRKKVKTVWGNPSYAIGDFELSQLLSRKKKNGGFFSQVNTESVTDEKTLEEIMFGFTKPTCQLACGPSILGDHIEHWNFVSMNLHHFGAPKEWNIKPSTSYLPVMQQMEKLQKNWHQEKFYGVCESTLSHREVFFPPSLLDCDNSVVIQKPGDVIIVHPSAIHNVKNYGLNMAESRNYLPFEFRHYIVSYKTCEHSEGLGGKPLFNKMRELTQNLPFEKFIHESDPNKKYKLRLIDYLTSERKNRHLEEAKKEIRRHHYIPRWFEDQLPISALEDGPKKRFACEYCQYSTQNHGDLKKHIKRIHPRGKVPPNTNQEECPNKCGVTLKCLRKHKKICRKR